MSGLPAWTHAKTGKTCFEIASTWAVPGKPPASDTPYAIYDRDKRELYRGRTDNRGIAHICVNRLPGDATMLLDPDHNTVAPSLIFENRNP